MIERTLIVIKPDGVERLLTGQILSRLETTGLKIIGLKMVKIDKKMAMRHYTEDLARRRGTHIRNIMIDYISTGPVVAAAIEGVNAIEVVRKIVGSTLPFSASPGTIRGDFSSDSPVIANTTKRALRNMIHASSETREANRELKHWFKKDELFNYKRSDEDTMFN